MRLWDLFRRRTAEPAPSVEPPPRPPVAAWRSMSPVQRTMNRPELVTAPDRFRDNLVSWQDPTLHRGLGHVVSPEAPSGLVHNLAVPSATDFPPPPSASPPPLASPSPLSPPPRSEILETYSRKPGTTFPRSELVTAPEVVAPPVFRPTVPVQRSAADSPAPAPPATRVQPEPAGAPEVPTIGESSAARSLPDPAETVDSPGTSVEPPRDTSPPPRRLGLGAPVQRMFDLPGLPDPPRVPSLPSTPNLPSAPSLPSTPNLPDLPRVPDLPSAPDLPRIPDLPSGVEPPALPSLPDSPSLPGPLPLADLPTIPEMPAFPRLPAVPALPDAIPSNPSDLRDHLPSEGFPTNGLVGDDPLTRQLPEGLTDALDGRPDGIPGELANGLPLPADQPSGDPLWNQLAQSAPNHLVSGPMERLPVSDLVGQLPQPLPVSLPRDAEPLRGLLPDMASGLPQVASGSERSWSFSVAPATEKLQDLSSGFGQGLGQLGQSPPAPQAQPAPSPAASPPSPAAPESADGEGEGSGGESVGGAGAGAGGEAGAPGASPAPGSSSSPTDVDGLVRRLYEPIARRLKAELRLDRERAGYPLDLRH